MKRVAFATVSSITLWLMASAFSFAAERHSDRIANSILSIEQTSSEIGDQLIWASPNRIDIVDKATGVRTTASAPDWNVYVIDEDRKTFASCKLASFKGFIPDSEMKLLGRTDWGEVPLFYFGGKAMVAGQAVFMYTTGDSFSGFQRKQLQKQFAAPTFVKSAEYCVSKNQFLSSQACSVLTQYYRLPQTHKLHYSTAGTYALRPPDFSPAHKKDMRRMLAHKDNGLQHDRALPLKFQLSTLSGTKRNWLQTVYLKGASEYRFRNFDLKQYKELATARDVKDGAKRTDYQQKTPAKAPLL